MEKDLLKQLESYAGIAYSTKETVLNTYRVCGKIFEERIKGAFIECGVAAGANLMSMLEANRQFGGKRKVMGFDSFEGIPIATKEDKQQPGLGWFENENPFFKGKEGQLISSGQTVHPIKDVLQSLTANGFKQTEYELVKGWFQNTLPQKVKEFPKGFKIAVLRLDGDLYESTKCCLENLFDFMNARGVIIADDYFTVEGCKLAIDEFFKKNKILIDIVNLDNVAYISFK
jgi:hypothetical protein